MTTKVVCDRCGKDVEHSDTQISINIASIVKAPPLFHKEKDYCKSCCDIVVGKIKTIANEELIK